MTKKRLLDNGFNYKMSVTIYCSELRLNGCVRALALTNRYMRQLGTNKLENVKNFDRRIKFLYILLRSWGEQNKQLQTFLINSKLKSIIL